MFTWKSFSDREFHSEILYDTSQNTQIAHIIHKIAHITQFKIIRILTGEEGPLTLNLLIKQQIGLPRMWANAQRDGRPAECRWRPLFNAANFG